MTAPIFEPRRAASPWRLPALLFWSLSRLILLLNVAALGVRCDEVFWRYGHATAALHLLPYRDYGTEYPPLAVAFFAIPGGASDWPHYAAWFAVTMLGVDLLTFALVRRTAARLKLWSDGWPAALLYAAFSFATSALLTKYDLVPGMLTLLAVAALVEERDGTAWVALATAVLFKGYAVALVPLFVLYRYYVRAAAPWWRGPLAGGLAAAAILLPIVAVAGPAFAHTLLFHAGRGLEIESIYASVVLVAHNLTHLAVWVTPGKAVLSRDVHSSLNGPLEAAAPLILAAGMAITYGAAWMRLRRDPTPRALCLLSMAAVTAFMLAFKALPTHYLLWIAPLAPVALGGPSTRTMRVAVAVGLAVGWGAVVPLPPVWLALRHLDTLAIAVIVGRNLAILATFALLVERSLSKSVS